MLSTVEGCIVLAVRDLPDSEGSEWEQVQAIALKVCAVRDGLLWAVIEDGVPVAFCPTIEAAEAVCRQLSGVARQGWQQG